MATEVNRLFKFENTPCNIWLEPESHPQQLPSRGRTVNQRTEEMSKVTEFRAMDPNPPYGNRGEFRKVTITMPQETYEQLITESSRRKIAREPNHPISALIREALLAYLSKART